MGDDLNVRVWRGSGHIRIYVSDSQGRDIGWYEPGTGRHNLADEALAGRFWAATGAESANLRVRGELDATPAGEGAPACGPSQRRGARFKGSARITQVTPAADADTADPAGQAGTAGAAARSSLRDDLANSEPGSLALAQARELRRQHPVRTLVADAIGLHSEARSFAIGARGERKVGRRLNRWAAANGWYVLHALPMGRHGGDLDHLVIGPFGVVTVNTKTTAKPVWVGEYGITVGGLKVDYIRAARAEARRAQARLARAAGIGVTVVPAIVFLGPRKFTVRRGGPPDVAVLPNPRALRRWLRRRRSVLDEADMDTIYAAARRPGTWAC